MYKIDDPQYKAVNVGEAEYKVETAQKQGYGPIRDTIMSAFMRDATKQGGSVATTPVISNGILFFGSHDTYLYAIDALDATLKWKFKTNGPIIAYLIVADERVYFRSLDNYLYTLSLDGALVWKSRVINNEGGCFALVDGVLYAGGGKDDCKMHAISAKDGTPMWEYRTGGIVSCMPAVVNDTIFFGSADGYIYALSKDGQLKWKFRTSDGVDCGSAVCDAHGNEVWSVRNAKNEMAVISDGVLYTGSWDNHVYALTLDGKELWRYRTNGPIFFSGPTVYRNTLYIGSMDGYLYALDAATGALKWKFRTNMAIGADPIIHNDVIYIGSLDNHLYAVSLEGKELWKFRTGGFIVLAAAVCGDKIYFGSWDGYLYSLSLKDQSLLWKFKPGKLEPVPVDLKGILGRAEELNKRILRLWKPETVGSKLLFSDHVSVNPMYRSAAPYATSVPYKTDSPYTSGAPKKKEKWWPF